MGGPPYKSKGCNTCRRRKVKCDETKPECIRCLKNSHICEGYQRNHVFVHNSHGKSSMATAVHRPRNSKLEKDTKTREDRSDSSTSDSVSCTFSQFDNRSSIRAQFVASFIDVFAPGSTAQYGNAYAGNYLQDMFPTFVGNSPVLDKAVTALSSAFLAKRNSDLRLLSYSTGLYGEAIKIVQNRIGSRLKCGQDELFATVIFQLYELINSSPLGFKAWLAHVQGSNAILAQYESSNSPSLLEHLFCRQLKFVTVCDAIGMRKSVHRYSPFWQKQASGSPWHQPIDDILDLLVECSILMERTDQLIQTGNPNRQTDKDTGELLLCDCLAFRDELDVGFCKMQEKLEAPWCSTKQSSFWSELDDSIAYDIFVDAIEYPSLACAESHLLYWTIFILLYPVLDQLLIFLGHSRSSLSFTLWDVPLSSKADRKNATWTADIPEDLIEVAEHYANLICRSAKFLVQPDNKALGAQIFLAPFSQATQFYRSIMATEKHRWCQMVFMQLPKLGFGIAPFLRDLFWPKYEAATGKRTPSPENRTIEYESPPYIH